MKIHKSLVLNLLAVGSLITGSAQAQELLFNATMGPTDPQITNQIEAFTGRIYPLGSQKETFGFLIHTTEKVETPRLSAIFQTTHSLKIFSVNGTELKNLTSTFRGPTAFNDVEVEIFPLEGGDFVVDASEVAKFYREAIYFSRDAGGNWVEKRRTSLDANPYYTVGGFATGMSPAGILAYFKKEGNAVVAEVYATNKAALTPPAPVPTITSDLGILDLKRNKTIQPYATKANVPVKDYLATGLPPGLKINPVTGEISGKPTTKGSFSVLIGATPLVGNSFFNTKTFRVK